MPLWSKTVKPKWLSPEQKSRTSLTPQGWVLTHPNGDKEILVASSSLYEAPVIVVPTTFLSTQSGIALTTQSNEFLEVL